jgi:hypothetical protein
MREFQQWALGCHCHEEELRRGKKVQCPMKGLRLLELPAKLKEVVNGLRGPVVVNTEACRLAKL